MSIYTFGSNENNVFSAVAPPHTPRWELIGLPQCQGPSRAAAGHCKQFSRGPTSFHRCRDTRSKESGDRYKLWAPAENGSHLGHLFSAFLSDAGALQTSWGPGKLPPSPQACHSPSCIWGVHFGEWRESPVGTSWLTYTSDLRLILLHYTWQFLVSCCLLIYCLNCILYSCINFCGCFCW